MTLIRFNILSLCPRGMKRQSKWVSFNSRIASKSSKPFWTNLSSYFSRLTELKNSCISGYYEGSSFSSSCDYMLTALDKLLAMRDCSPALRRCGGANPSAGLGLGGKCFYLFKRSITVSPYPLRPSLLAAPALLQLDPLAAFLPVVWGVLLAEVELLALFIPLEALP